MRFIEFLVEAPPIGRYQIRTQTRKGGTIPSEERRTLRRLKPIATKKFKGTEHTFDFYFWNIKEFPSQKGEDPEEIRKSDWMYSLVYTKDPGVYPPHKVRRKFKLPIQPRKDAVSVLFLSNINPQKETFIPWTPWIMAHRAFHGIEDGIANTGEIPSKVLTAYHQMRENIQELGFDTYFMSAFGTQRSARVAFGGQPRPRGYRALRASRTPEFEKAVAYREALENEFDDEYFAQWLITGKVTFARVKKKVVEGEATYFYLTNGHEYLARLAEEDLSVKQLNERLKKAEQVYMKGFKSILDACVGYVIVTP